MASGYRFPRIASGAEPDSTRVLALIANPALGLFLGLAAWSAGGLAACLPLGRPWKVLVPVGRP